MTWDGGKVRSFNFEHKGGAIWISGEGGCLQKEIQLAEHKGSPIGGEKGELCARVAIAISEEKSHFRDIAGGGCPASLKKVISRNAH